MFIVLSLPFVTAASAGIFEYTDRIEISNTELCNHLAKSETLLSFLEDFRLSFEVNHPKIVHTTNIALAYGAYEAVFEATYYGSNGDGFEEFKQYTYKTTVKQTNSSCLISKPVLQ